MKCSPTTLHLGSLFLLCGLLTAIVLLAAPNEGHARALAPAAAVYYVKANAAGNNSGDSWTNAFTDLQDALAAVEAGDQIWVAAGTYRPTGDGFFRSASFVLQPGVALYGGFAGNEASLDARDWQANQTILSGDVGEPGVQGDNSYHVVYGSDINLDTVLDGFIVRDGYANGGGHETHGGAIYLLNGNPTLTRLLITSNFAQGNGGAMYLAGDSNPVLSYVTFSGNSTGTNAGALFVGANNSPTLNNVTFSGNWAAFTAGALTNSDNNGTTLTNVIFTGNVAGTSGGAIYNWNSNPMMVNVLFSLNNAGTLGGAIMNEGGAPLLTNVTFSNNSAATGGGVLYQSAGSITLRNAIIWNNSNSTAYGEDNLYFEDALIQGGCPSGGNCTNILDADPLFVDAPNNLRLNAGSPAIDAGNNSHLPIDVTTDLDGGPRIVGVAVDLGAYENPEPYPYRVWLPLTIKGQ